MSECAVDSCTKDAKRRTWCRTHYQRWLRYGDPAALDRRYGSKPGQSLAVRFEQSVERTAAGCWRWTGSINDKGYGSLSYKGQKLLAHRVAYGLYVGEHSEDLVLDHLCHTWSSDCRGNETCPHRRCVNPDHLEPVTQRENILRGVSPVARRAASATCEKGHVFPEAQAEPGQRRVCRERANVRNREYKARLKAARPAPESMPVTHGRSRYVHQKCRCDVCSTAEREYQRARRSRDVYDVVLSRAAHPEVFGGGR